MTAALLQTIGFASAFSPTLLRPVSHSFYRQISSQPVISRKRSIWPSPLAPPAGHHNIGLINRPQPPRSSRNFSPTRLHSFFGLGLPEIAIILLAGIIFIGPQNLTQLSKEAGSVAGKTAAELGEEWKELKAIPEEFQKGLEEGEINARSRKAKVMEDAGEE